MHDSIANEDGGIIPLYTGAYARELKRARDAVYRKIGKIIKIPPDGRQEKEAGDTFTYYTGVFLKGKILNTNRPDETWKKRVNDCEKYSGITLTEHQKHDLDETTRIIMRDLLDAFYLRYLGEKINKPSPVDRQESEKAILNIYVNHITREALSKIKNYGFTDRSTLSLMGFIIHNSGLIYSRAFEPTYASDKDTVVEPEIGPSSSEVDAIKSIKEIMGYWKEEYFFLKEKHRMNISKFSEPPEL